MGFWKHVLVTVGATVGGPIGGMSVLVVEHGGKVLEGSIDAARQIVTLGKDVYRAIRPEVMAFGGAPLHGLLKHEAEDDIILLGEIAGRHTVVGALHWPVLGPVGASTLGVLPTFVAGGAPLIGKIHSRLLNDEEWAMTRHIFGDSLFERSQIVLTNIGGIKGRAFVLPMGALGVYVNLGKHYEPDVSTINAPLLFHELTHVWQARQFMLTGVFLYDTLPGTVFHKYEFVPGNQWATYSNEQQASMVEAWACGATERTHSGGFNTTARKKITMNSPLFRYVNGNIRRSRLSAETGSGGSVRQLLADGGHTSMRQMCAPPPEPWWKCR